MKFLKFLGIQPMAHRLWGFNRAVQTTETERSCIKLDGKQDSKWTILDSKCTVLKSKSGRSKEHRLVDPKGSNSAV